MVRLDLLREAIKKSGFKDKHIAQSAGINDKVFSNRMRGRTSFSIEEAERVANVLGLSLAEFGRIFLARE